MVVERFGLLGAGKLARPNPPHGRARFTRRLEPVQTATKIGAVSTLIGEVFQSLERFPYRQVDQHVWRKHRGYKT